jgi:LAS superfamily LD-carboxypeptidase LdcB
MQAWNLAFDGFSYHITGLWIEILSETRHLKKVFYKLARNIESEFSEKGED